MRWFLYKLYQAYLFLRRPVTLGARVLVVKDGKVLLVRMTYVNDWYLPGGGVARGETFREAAVRELREECGLQAESAELYGVYLSRKSGAVDHIALYVIEQFNEIPGARPDVEIREMGFFAFDQLPAGVSPATLRRIEDYRRGQKGSERW